jgi:flagellin
MTQLSTEIDRIAGTTSWAGINLLDGATPNTNSLATLHLDVKNISLAVGSGTTNLDSISVNIGALSASALNIGGGTSTPAIATTVNANGAAGILLPPIPLLWTQRLRFQAVLMLLIHTLQT